MNVTLTVVGAVFVGIAIIGGGLRVGGVEVATLSRGRIIALAVFGLITMALGWGLEWRAADQALEGRPQLVEVLEPRGGVEVTL